MGQTLPNGIYLPAEGERNCYDGLEGNWRSLDGLISTVAGKASASHTHGNITNDGKVGTAANKPLITGTGGVVQAGSFGTLANTFCEGNDSRLSDARTPVAHTHTKSDVTDLLNSNFIPSANNSYDLGSSSYQWNNLYAKNYFYNGTQWGLDQANTWSGSNTFSDSVLISSSQNKYLRIKNTSWDLGQSIPASNKEFGGITFRDKDDENMGYIIPYDYTTGNTVIRFLCRQKYTSNARDPNGANVDSNLYLGVSNTGIKYIETDGYIRNRLVPFFDNYYDLGTSSYKWKTLNGINPGALSLPSASYIDISSSITDRNYGANYYTAPSNGYVCIGSMASSLQISNDTLGFGISAGTAQDGYSSVYIPVRTGDTVRILLNQTSTDYQTFRFYSCQGNV